MAGGRRSGRERKAHGCSPRAGEAIALARGLRSQPRVPVSVIHTLPAATAPRNLRRVILLLKALSLPCHHNHLIAYISCVGRWYSADRTVLKLPAMYTIFGHSYPSVEPSILLLLMNFGECTFLEVGWIRPCSPSGTALYGFYLM